MDVKFKFVYPIIQVEQLAFRDDGTTYKHFVLSHGEGHILYQGRLMCGKNLPKDKKNKVVTKTLRIEGSKICLECQEKYKKNLESDWNMWAEGKAKDVGKSQETIKEGLKI